MLIQFKKVDWSDELQRTEQMVDRCRLALALARAYVPEDVPKIRHQKREYNRKLLRLRKIR